MLSFFSQFNDEFIPFDCLLCCFQFNYAQTITQSATNWRDLTHTHTHSLAIWQEFDVFVQTMMMMSFIFAQLVFASFKDIVVSVLHWIFSISQLNSSSQVILLNLWKRLNPFSPLNGHNKVFERCDVVERATCTQVCIVHFLRARQLFHFSFACNLFY